MKHITAITVLILAGIMTLSAQVPNQMGFQGRLADNGTLVNSNDMPIVLTIYDGPDGGATAIYQENDTVDVVDGFYDTVIGDNPVTGGGLQSSLSDALTVANGTAWLGVAVAGETEFTPRKQLLSVPYAVMSGNGDSGGGVASRITESDTNAWHTAVSWGDHAQADYMASTGGMFSGDVDLGSNFVSNIRIMPSGDVSMGDFTAGF